ncbi:chromosomal replication initiator protein DnaA [Hominifimenecus sp. rT4P-3]|uniref:chromosomal replication initiator protein DnaA n=1 Tax=Hominifimenecus sp. rT4P-3 TaxID=3242979 RepID=UPI003DA1D990
MLQKIKENWETILNTLKEDQELTDVSFKTWLLPLELVSVENNIITILFPGDKPSVLYIEKKYKFFIQVAIEEVTGNKCEIKFITPHSDSEPEVKKASMDLALFAEANLNPRYTFDTFVVGSNNKMAHAASLAVAESPAEIYNPLFIYGGVGLGKTHLMHSIAHFILKQNPTAKVVYVTSEKFTNELIDAIRNKNNITTTEFREKYRNVDVLLIDDIQFITNKESTQEEVFHTFNTLYEAKKQIIISSDRPPKDIETLEERLRSRFEWGLTVDIGSPDYETRMAILRKKEDIEGYNIDNEVIKYIAMNIKSNIRELEGALTKIVACSRVTKKDITVELAEEALKDHISPNQVREITPEIIIEIVSDHFKLNPSDLTSEKRNKEIVKPRQIVMYLCRTMTNTSLQMIAKYLGKRDHSTIIHGIEKITAELEKDESLQYTIDILKKKLNPS